MQSASMSEEGSAGIRSEREETPAENTENPLADLLTKHCVNYCRANGIENPVEIFRCAQKFDCKGKATGCARCF